MAVSPSSFVRWSIRIGAGSCAVAMALGRMCGPVPILRSVEPARFASIPEWDGEATLSLLDVQSGSVHRIELPGGDSLENASCSPWREESGQGQVVGRWRTRSGHGAERVTTGFGLARYSLPDGECLDRVPTEILPQGPPCWYPGTKAQILFATSDGGLYRYNFEGDDALRARSPGRDPRPHPITWKVAPPGEGERSVHIADPVWPSDRVFGGRIFVSLRLQVSDGNGGMKLSAPRTWWIMLDSRGEAIEAAGSLNTEDFSDQARTHVRFPRPFRLADGSLRLASLVRPSRGTDWDLTVSKIRLGADGSPSMTPHTEVVAAKRCAFAPLANSHDGNWVYYIPEDAPTGWVLRSSTTPREGRSVSSKRD